MPPVGQALPAMLKLGCITDDFAGARDLGLSLVSAGMRVIQTLGVPHAPLDTLADGVVVTLKSRYASPGDAVFRALDALVWLKSQVLWRDLERFVLTNHYCELYAKLGDKRGQCIFDSAPSCRFYWHLVGTDSGCCP